MPGYLIPQYYFDYLSSGDARPLAGVFYHNVFDIVSLAVLFDYMANVLDSPSDFNLHSLDVVAVARLYEENGRIEDAAELYEQGLSSGLPEDVFFEIAHSPAGETVAPQPPCQVKQIDMIHFSKRQWETVERKPGI